MGWKEEWLKGGKEGEGMKYGIWDELWDEIVKGSERQFRSIFHFGGEKAREIEVRKVLGYRLVLSLEWF